MAAYNPMSALSATAGASADGLGLGVNVNHAGAGSLSLEGFDRDIGFDDVLLDNVGGLAPLPFTPTYDFETFSNTFEDPFPYSAGPAGRPYELAQLDADGGFHESVSSQDEGLDNKLLGFSGPVVKAAVIDDAGQFAEPAMTAELFGMFFLAEDVYSTENTGRPLELTCYRRNLWWCSGQITLPRQITHAVTADEGRHVAVLELAASITAMESIEGKPTEIICIPWKSTAANGPAPNPANTTASAQHEDTKAAGSPPNLLIDLANGQELENGLVSVPISWKRLQFKHATANNGRRKGQQQHYVVQINLLARVKPDSSAAGNSSSRSSSSGSSNSSNGCSKIEAQTIAAAKDGEAGWLKIAEIQSGPVIVRGRSPRNFVSRRDVPLTASAGIGGTAVVDKKQQQQQPQPFDRPEASAHLQHRGSSCSSGGDLQSFQRYSALGNAQQGDWTHGYAQQSPHPAKKAILSPNLTRPPVPPWDTPSRMPSKMLSQQQQQQQQQQQKQQQQQQQQQHPHQHQQFQHKPLQHMQPHQLQHPHQQQLQHPHLYQQAQPPPPKKRANSTALPLSLSLSEDERSPNRLGTDPLPNSPPFPHLGGSSSSSMSAGSALPGKSAAASAKMAGSNSGSSTGNTGSSSLANNTGAASAENPFEDDDLLYEYFPLSLDDWMPPVDAVYRPHVVHHTVVPPEVKAQQVRNKTKRYFAAE